MQKAHVRLSNLTRIGTYGQRTRIAGGYNCIALIESQKVQSPYCKVLDRALLGGVDSEIEVA